MTRRMSPLALCVRQSAPSLLEPFELLKPRNVLRLDDFLCCAVLSLVLRERGAPKPHSPSDRLPARSLERLREGVL